MPAPWKSSGNAASTPRCGTAGLPKERTGLIVWTETLAGREIERRVPGRATAKNMAMTPVQELPLRAGRSRTGHSPICGSRRSGRVALQHRDDVVHPERPDAVTGMLTDRTTGAETPFTARYLIAAEGAQSRVRRALGVNDGRRREGLRQRQYPVPRRSHPMGQGPAGRALFRRAGRSARDLPHHQRHGTAGVS